MGHSKFLFVKSKVRSENAKLAKWLDHSVKIKVVDFRKTSVISNRCWV